MSWVKAGLISIRRKVGFLASCDRFLRHMVKVKTWEARFLPGVVTLTIPLVRPMAAIFFERDIRDRLLLDVQPEVGDAFF